MNNVKLFWMDEDRSEELRMDETLIGEVQKQQIEENLSVLFGMRFVIANYPIGQDVIDTLALDRNLQPVLLMYLRNPLQSPIHRGLNAIAWLQKHQSELRLLILHHLGPEIAAKIQYQQPRLLCLSDFFSETEISTAALTSVAIELLGCHYHGENLLAIERVVIPTLLEKHNPYQKEIDHILDYASETQRQLYREFVALLQSQGDDHRLSTNEGYLVWTRLRNVARVRFEEDYLEVHLNLPPEAVLIDEMQYDFIVHHPDQEEEHGSVLLQLHNSEELLLCSELILRAYRFN